LVQGYRIWNFPALGRGRRLSFRPLWSSLGRHDAFVRRKLGRRRSNAIALAVGPGSTPVVRVLLREQGRWPPQSLGGTLPGRHPCPLGVGCAINLIGRV